MRSLRLTPAQLDEMRGHVEACLPEEACGLLAGSSATIREVLPIQNQAASPVRFRMDPAEQLRAFDHIETQGWQLLAIYHSHPSGPSRPSATDLAEAAYDVVQLIWSRGEAGWKVNGFWISNGTASEVELYVADGEANSTTGD